MYKMKYTNYIYDAIIEYYNYNFNRDISYEEIDKMSRKLVLSIYLEWEGIIGYDDDILTILNIK